MLVDMRPPVCLLTSLVALPAKSVHFEALVVAGNKQIKGVMPKNGITPLGHRQVKPGENTTFCCIFPSPLLDYTLLKIHQ